MIKTAVRSHHFYDADNWFGHPPDIKADPLRLRLEVVNWLDKTGEWWYACHPHMTMGQEFDGSWNGSRSFDGSWYAFFWLEARK